LIDRGSGTFHVEARNTTAHARPPTNPGLIHVDCRQENCYEPYYSGNIFSKVLNRFFMPSGGNLQLLDLANEYNQRAPFNGFSTN
jgi:hypothetical protein